MNSCCELSMCYLCTLMFCILCIVMLSFQLMTVLREDEFARKDRLADQLEYVNQLLNSNSRVN